MEGGGALRVWKWHCTTHDLSFLTLQIVDRPPVECSGLAEIVYPYLGPCWFDGSPVLSVYATGDRAVLSARRVTS